MTEPLTEKNGVMCPRCFATIVLTGTGVVRRKGKVGHAFDRMMGPDFFKVECPSCGVISSYEYADVRPIAPTWEDQKFAYEARIRALELELTSTKKDAQAIARAYHNEHSEEGTDTPSATPPETAQKHPTPPEEPSLKKKDEKPAYLQ